MSCDFYVYEHWRPDLNVCFWVGKGTGDRAYRLKRNASHGAVVTELSALGLKVDVRIVADGLSNIRALGIECERIAYWKAGGIALANRTDGGRGSGKVISAETREKLRIANLGKKHSEETRAKMRESHKRNGRSGGGRKPGFSHSDETRSKMRASQAGRITSEQTREKIRIANLGKTASEETKAKMRASQLKRDPSTLVPSFPKGSKRPASTRLKMSIAQKGHPVSIETRAKLSEIARGQYNTRGITKNGRFRSSLLRERAE